MYTFVMYEYDEPFTGTAAEVLDYLTNAHLVIGQDGELLCEDGSPADLERVTQEANL